MIKTEDWKLNKLKKKQDKYKIIGFSKEIHRGGSSGRVKHERHQTPFSLVN